MRFNPLNIFKRSAPQGTIQPGGGASFLMLFDSDGVERRKSRKEQLGAYAGWVYAAVTMLADDFARVPWRAVLETSSGAKEDPRSPLKMLLKNFVGLTSLEAKALTLIHLLLTGEAFWLVITAGGKEGGRPIGLQVLNPDWLEVESTRNGVSVTQWRLSVPGFESRLVSGEDVVHFRLPNPEGGARGFSPVRAFALSFDSDLYARAYSADLLKNQARPDGLLTSDQPITNEQAMTIRARWQEQVKRGEIAVLGAGSKYQPVASSMKDLEFLSLAQLNREAVLSIYRVPASKLGVDTSRSQADAAVGDVTYQRNALAPHVARFDDTINTYLAPRVGKEIFQHDDPVAQNRAEKRKEALELWQNGLMTANQALTYLDWDAIGNDGNVRMLPGSYRIVKKLEPTKETEAPVMDVKNPEASTATADAAA